MNKQKKKLPLAMQIFIALILAIVVGLLMQSQAAFTENYIKPFGTIFLNLLKFIVVPIVLFSIMCGIISMKDIKKVGTIGLKTVLYYMCTTAFAITIGLIGGNIFQRFFPVIATTDLAYEMPEKTSVMDTIVNIFPSNFISPMVESNMLQVIVIALLLGFSIIKLGEKNIGIVKACNNINEIFMKCMEMILKLSPIGVFCLLCPVVASNGAAIIGSLAMVLLAAYICYILHAVVVYSVAVKTMGGISPAKFFKEMLPAIMFAFSSASSVGTLPINMECVEKLGAKKRSIFLCTSIGSYHQYGWNCNLSGRMCNFHCILLRYSSDITADDDHYSDGNIGIHWYRRRSGFRDGHVGNGADFRRTSGRRHCTGSWCGSYF